MNIHNKLTTKSKTDEQQQALGQHQLQPEAGREFASVEEMLRHDALHTPVPPAISFRLQASINQTPRPTPTWWQRWFGGPRQ
jgi:hypothetical protein